MYVIQKSLIYNNRISEQSHYASLNASKVQETYERAVLNELQSIFQTIGVLDHEILECRD